MYSIELLKGQPLLVRFGEDHHKYGDAYNGTVIIEIVDGVALIKGLTKMPPKSWINELFAELKEEYKLSKITWERIKNSEVKHVVKSKA